MLCEGFDEKDAERPDIGRGSYISGVGFRGIVDVTNARAPAEVWRELHLVIDNHDVGWPEMTVRETALVKIGEGIQNGAEHFPSFLGRERTLGKNLRKGFIGILRYDIEQIFPIKFTAPGTKKRHEVRMGDGLGCFPSSDGGAPVQGFEFENFYGGLLCPTIIKLGYIGRAPLRPAQLLEKGEFSVDDALDRNGVRECRTHGGPDSNPVRGMRPYPKVTCL